MALAETKLGNLQKHAEKYSHPSHVFSHSNLPLARSNKSEIMNVIATAIRNAIRNFSIIEIAGNNDPVATAPDFMCQIANSSGDSNFEFQMYILETQTNRNLCAPVCVHVYDVFNDVYNAAPCYPPN